MQGVMSETENLVRFHDRQLAAWPEARERYEALTHVRVREISLGGFTVRLQFNPGRAVSTGARTDSASIAARPCFLCAANRPAEQCIFDAYPGVDTLVNPFPIFRRHFTIAAKDHRHQDTVDFVGMSRIASTLPGMVTFYNGSQAGASAPDHLHIQAGEKDFLPLCAYLEAEPGELMKSDGSFSAYSPDGLPVSAVHFTSRQITPEMCLWLDTLLPADSLGVPRKGMRNVLMWSDAEGCLHTVLLPRAVHRPACYFRPEEEGRLMVSPGAVDMAGVLILPREADFENISRTDIRQIYDEVSFPYKESPQFQRLLLL